jgi:hypothetical protein
MIIYQFKYKPLNIINKILSHIVLLQESTAEIIVMSKLRCDALHDR